MMTTIVGLLILAIPAGFIFGRKYERKQFIKVGKRKPSTQDIILGRKQ